MKRPIILLFCALCLCTLPAARAVTIDENTTGPSAGTGVDFWGESFITPAGSSFNNIVFTFLAGGPGTNSNFATGTGFLTSVEYTGTPAGLGSAAGLLGQAAASGNLYTFASGITLAPLTTYYFYENASVPANTMFGGNVYAGHQLYVSSGSGSNFGGGGSPLNFRVTGSPVPEPSTTALLLSAGLAGLFVARRAKRS